MRSPHSLIALSALLLCASRRGDASGRGDAAPSASSPEEEEERGDNSGTPRSHVGRGASPEPGGGSRTSWTTGGGEAPPVMLDSPASGASPLCAYRVMEGGIGGKLCFRNTLRGYKCREGDCRTVLTADSLVANILLNGSVLLQWRRGGGDADAGSSPGTMEGTQGGAGAGSRRRGYELSCWWNGSYTQFECAGVLLGPGCRDFLLTELHERIPYRICLRALGPGPPQGGDRQDCVEFTLSPSGMQDIVIAMTTVGGAICVMLVIICLLVAYITENIMSPTTQHTYSYRTRSHH